MSLPAKLIDVNHGAPVLYATWEDEPDEVWRRLSQISGAEAPWVSPRKLHNFHVADMVATGPIWAPEQGTHISTVTALNEDGERLRRHAERIGAKLLVLDPVAAAYGADENSRALVRQFLASWNGWGQRTGCATMLVHHPPKGEEEPYAGSSDWHNGVRALWSMAKKKQGPPPAKNQPSEREEAWMLELHKSNYGPPQPPLRLDMEMTPGADEVPGGMRWRASWWDDVPGDDDAY